MGGSDALLDAFPDWVIVSDKEGHVRSLRGAASHLAPVAPKPCTLEDVLPADLARRVAANFDRESAARVECTIDAESEERHLEARICALSSDERLVIVRDVTHRTEELTARLHQIEKEARAEAMLEIAYAASHDLRAPLRHIQSLSEWLDEDLGSAISDDTKKTLALLRRNVAKMSELLTALLEYARVGSDKVSLEEVDLRESVRTIADMLPTQGFEIVADPSLPTLVTARGPFERVILNLITNAVKHHDRSTGTVTISAEPAGDHDEITVADDGPGIPEERRIDAFKLFTTLGGAKGGSGMGLALVKKIVELAGGRIWVEPNEPRGCAFHFTWPREWAGAVSPDAEAESPPSKRVLVVDDSALARDLTRRMLGRRGFDVVEAEGAENAMAILAAQSVNAVVTDIHMPRVDGFTLIQNIRSDQRLSHLPVLVLTAEPGRNYADHAERLGASAYLVKPVRGGELATRLNAAIDERK